MLKIILLSEFTSQVWVHLKILYAFINTFVGCFKRNCLDDWQQETMAKLI